MKLLNLCMQNLVRCGWCEKDDLYRHYHDNEWGRQSHDDRHLFEHLILETFQAGLSWHTILSKRENFRKAFDAFDPKKISVYNEKKIDELMNNTGIIRSKAKILAAINNANRYFDCVKEFGTFDKFIWKFTDYTVIYHKRETLNDLPATSAESDAMSNEMKKRGFKFIGSTTCYAYMQSVGMINDHLQSCWLYGKI